MPISTLSRGRALVYLAVAVAALAVGVRFLGPTAPAPMPGETLAELAAEPPAPALSPAQEPLVVHVTGAVRRPGIYRLPVGSRVDDAIQEAGGARLRAALEAINLAAPVVDGQQVVVPNRGEGLRPEGAPRTGDAHASGPVSLSTATLEELEALPGIGPVTAQSILEYREENGGFSTVEELDAVPGIGPARLEQLRDLVAP